MAFFRDTKDDNDDDHFINPLKRSVHQCFSGFVFLMMM
jgi:hypothetical protein